MKKFFWTLIILLVMAASAFAQVPKPVPFSIYAAGAVTVPNSPDGFSENYKTGYHFYGGIGMKMFPLMQLVGKAEYTSMSVDFADQTSAEGGTQKIWMFGADSRFSLGAPLVPFKPFLFGGAGLASISAEPVVSNDDSWATAFNDEIGAGETVNKLYWNVGAGFEFKTSPMMSFFVQGRFVSIATEGDPTVIIPFSLGLKFF